MNELSLNYMFAENMIRTVVTLTEIWFVLKDVCYALGIANNRNVYDRLDEDEKGVRQMDTLGGKQNIQVVNESGLYTVILRSDSPKAKEFRRWVTHVVLPSIRKKGYFSLMSDEELVQFIMERQKQRPTTLDLLKPSQIKATMHKEMVDKRDERTEELKELWIRRFGRKEQIAMGPELRRICAGDKALYHKYIDKYHQDEQKELKGQIIMF